MYIYMERERERYREKERTFLKTGVRAALVVFHYVTTCYIIQTYTIVYYSILYSTLRACGRCPSCPTKTDCE